MRQSVALVLLLALHFALRLPSLGLLPLYSDEALGLWRAERVLEGSLTRGAGEGKPLHAWMIAAALSLGGDPIRAARAAHVAAGAIVVLALWEVARRRLSPEVAWTAAALWVVLPFPSIFERTVSPDVPLAAAGAAVLASSIHVASSSSPGSRGWFWTLLASGAAATFLKMPVGLLVAAIPLLVPLTLPVVERPAARSRLRPYGLALAALVVVLAAIVAARAALGSRPLGFGVHELGLKVAVIRAPEEAPGALGENLWRLGEFGWLYLGTAGTVLLLSGVVGAWLSRNALLRVATGFAVAWTALFALAARNLSAHYLLPVLPLYVLAMAWALVEVAAAVERRVARTRGFAGRRLGAIARPLVAAVIVGIGASSWPLLRALWVDPTTAKLARIEREQYVEGSWSGYGFPEAARLLERELAAGGPAPVVLVLHVADYERLRLYAASSARPAIVQAQIDRYTLRVPTMIARAEALLRDGRRVLAVVGSEGRFSRRWREAFPSSRRLGSFPKPGGTHAAQVWELLK